MEIVPDRVFVLYLNVRKREGEAMGRKSGEALCERGLRGPEGPSRGPQPRALKVLKGRTACTSIH